MIKYKNKASVSFFLFVCLLGISFTTSAQDRPRVVPSSSSRPTNQPPQTNVRQEQPSSVSRPVSQRPVLTNDINIQPAPPLVKRTGESSPLTAMNKAVARRSLFSNVVTNDLVGAIQNKLGIPYKYGSSGPNRYDCSGFVWAVFGEAGMKFERTSARSLWSASIPVTGDDRYIFGTLVFMNKLGHMGIVADSEGFYHASSSKGITYSKFAGYWEKRIDGFRRLVLTPSEDQMQ